MGGETHPAHATATTAIEVAKGREGPRRFFCETLRTQSVHMPTNQERYVACPTIANGGTERERRAKWNKRQYTLRSSAELQYQ